MILGGKEEQVLSLSLHIYKTDMVNLDATWNCRSMKKKQGIEHADKHKMTTCGN